MLTQPQVQRYSNESGLRDIMIAEKEVVLTFLLQLMSERGILDKLAFKGGTCLRFLTAVTTRRRMGCRGVSIRPILTTGTQPASAK